MKKQRLTCEKARDISIIHQLESLGHIPKRITIKEAWFLSPFRSETQASFKVDLRINRWYDHGMGKGGNVIDLIMELNNFSVEETLAFLNGNTTSFSFHQQQEVEPKKSYSIKRIVKLSNFALINYISERGINQDIATNYCAEIYYAINNKNFFAIAFKNNSGGYEIRNKYFKGSFGKKDITTIKNQSDTLVIFEGFIDFLSYSTIYENAKKNEDYLILNSISFIEKASKIGQKYNQVITCLDNDNSGKKATEFLKANCKNIMDCSFVFNGYKDLNEYLIGRSKVVME